jgi:hypothetical protein
MFVLDMALFTEKYTLEKQAREKYGPPVLQ